MSPATSYFHASISLISTIPDIDKYKIVLALKFLQYHQRI